MADPAWATALDSDDAVFWALDLEEQRRKPVV